MDVKLLTVLRADTEELVALELLRLDALHCKCRCGRATGGPEEGRPPGVIPSTTSTVGTGPRYYRSRGWPRVVTANGPAPLW
jgi:hypothetical protein